MKRKLTTGSGLAMAVFAMVIALSTLIGTTFAWFTDTTGSDYNKIISGNLDVGMNYWNSDSGEYLDASNVPLFDNEALWEPGYMDIAYLEIANLGDLAFNYLFAVYPTEETLGYLKSGKTFYLSDYLIYAAVEYDVEESGEIASLDDALDLIEDTHMGVSEENLKYGELLPGQESVRLALIVYMPTYVSSAQANHDPASGHPAPSLKLAVDVYATQKTYEHDSFSDQYDAGLTPVWKVPIWRYAPEGYTVDTASKTITVDSVDALKYLGKLYDDMVSHPQYEPSEWTIVLGSDLDFGGEVLTEPLRFGGFKKFDGNHKTITNVILNYILVDEQIESVGLFDELPSTSDLTLDNVTVKSETTAAGALAGKLTGDSYSGISIVDSSVSGVGFIGGMIGWGNFLHPIDFSGIQILRTDIDLFGDGSGSAGGIAGYYGGGSSATVKNSTVQGVDASGVDNAGSYFGGLFGEVDADLDVSLSTITEITIYRDIYIGAITGKIYSSRDVKLTNNTVSVVVTDASGEKSIVPLTGSGDIEDTNTEIDWEEVESISGALKTTYNGHFYEVFVTSSDITWTAAKESCESKYGHLVTITTAGENSAVVTIVNRFANSAWLGAYRPVCYGHNTGPHDFVWVTGEEWSYSNWDSGEPNDSHTHQGGCENCLHMYGSGKWNDYQNNHTNMRGYVCEWDSLQSYLNYLTSLNG